MSNTKLTKTILLIDFSGEIFPELCDRLCSLQYLVIEADTLDSALGHIRETDLSTVFVNSTISDAAGERIFEALGSGTTATPIVMVLSDDAVPEKLGCVHREMFTLLARPITPSVLEHILLQPETTPGLIGEGDLELRTVAEQNTALESMVRSLERQNKKLQREHNELSQSAARYRENANESEAMERQFNAVQIAIDSTREAVLILGDDGRVQYRNTAFQDVFGCTQIDGDVFPVCRIFPDPDTSERISRSIEVLGTFSSEVTMIDHNGKEIPTFVNANVVGDAGEGNRGMLYLIADLSEQERLRKEAHHDCLTDLYTRRYFLNLLSTNISMIQRHEQELSLCLCDLDHFKLVNDTHGHRMGDRVLEIFARIVSQEIRTEDCAGRIGGDEFVLMFPQVDAAVASVCMERIRTRFEGIAFKSDEGKRFHCSATFGVADCPTESLTAEAFLDLADKSLYRAKEKGRNCTVVNMERVGTPTV